MPITLDILKQRKAEHESAQKQAVDQANAQSVAVQIYTQLIAEWEAPEAKPAEEAK